MRLHLYRALLSTLLPLGPCSLRGPPTFWSHLPQLTPPTIPQSPRPSRLPLRRPRPLSRGAIRRALLTARHCLGLSSMPPPPFRERSSTRQPQALSRQPVPM